MQPTALLKSRIQRLHISFLFACSFRVSENVFGVADHDVSDHDVSVVPFCLDDLSGEEPCGTNLTRDTWTTGVGV
jgi:hypothetical protein